MQCSTEKNRSKNGRKRSITFAKQRKLSGTNLERERVRPGNTRSTFAKNVQEALKLG